MRLCLSSYETLDAKDPPYAARKKHLYVCLLHQSHMGRFETSRLQIGLKACFSAGLSTIISQTGLGSREHCGACNLCGTSFCTSSHRILCLTASVTAGKRTCFGCTP